jgi:uncharacterized protein YggE
MADTTITVRGEHSAWYPAERATASVAVHVDGPKRDVVFSNAVAASETIRGLVEPLAASTPARVTWWTSDNVRVWSERPWSNDGKRLPLVYHAAIDFSVKFGDFDALSTWIEAVAAVEFATVGSIVWDLTDATRKTVTNDVRTAAVADAVAKATTFARSIGLDSVTALALADPGMLGDAPGGGGGDDSPTFRGAMKMQAYDGGGPPVLALKPEEIVVASAVDARFVAGKPQEK